MQPRLESPCRAASCCCSLLLAISVSVAMLPGLAAAAARAIRVLLAAALMMTWAGWAFADDSAYALVTVGDAGNPASLYGYGTVGYEFRIGTYEVTIGQYAAFLNAVAASDPYALYHPRMATDLNVAGITRSGVDGSYAYAVIDNSGDSGGRPITYVGWFDAARFANWMANGRATSFATPEAAAAAINDGA